MKSKKMSIEAMKFIAVFLVANSHMGLMYGKYSFLATGGALGDALFFFCSGFTLFLSRCDRFDNWYKRRICRIYPSVFAWALISDAFFDRHLGMKSILFHGGGWFITCIMIYYVILYFVRKKLFDKKWISFAISGSIVLVWYLFFHDNSSLGIYSSGDYFAWAIYFLFMLLGAYLGAGKIELCSIRLRYNVILFLISLVSYYGLQYLCVLSDVLVRFQLVTLIPMFGVIIFLYKICDSSMLNKLMDRRIGNVVKAIAGLCLESYLVQFSLITDKMNGIFPLNLVIVMIAILIMAYVVKCLGRVFVQVFRNEDFRWKDVVSLS